MCQLKNKYYRQISSANHDARHLGFGALDGEEDGEHNRVGFVETSDIFSTQNSLVFGIRPCA